MPRQGEVVDASPQNRRPSPPEADRHHATVRELGRRAIFRDDRDGADLARPTLRPPQV